MTDSLTCPGLILKESLTVQLLQNGDSITWTLFPVWRERTFHLIHLFATAVCSYRIEVIFFFIQSMAFSWPVKLYLQGTSNLFPYSVSFFTSNFCFQAWSWKTKKHIYVFPMVIKSVSSLGSNFVFQIHVFCWLFCHQYFVPEQKWQWKVDKKYHKYFKKTKNFIE